MYDSISVCSVFMLLGIYVRVYVCACTIVRKVSSFFVTFGTHLSCPIEEFVGENFPIGQNGRVPKITKKTGHLSDANCTHMCMNVFFCDKARDARIAILFCFYVNFTESATRELQIANRDRATQL